MQGSDFWGGGILQLFESEKYEEAALHAATSPKVRGGGGGGGG